MGISTFYLWRKRLFETNWLLKLLSWCIPLPLVAIQFGWIVAEVGRQPWIVYRLLKTRDAASVTVAAGEILFSIIMFGLIYVLLGAVWLFLLKKELDHGPQPAHAAGKEAN